MAMHLILRMFEWLLIQQYFAAAIWPQPQALTLGTTVLWYSPDVSLRITIRQKCQPTILAQQRLSPAEPCHEGPVSLSTSDKELIELEFSQFQHDIVDTSFVPWKFNPRDSNFEPTPDDDCTKLLSVVVDIFPNAVQTSDSHEAYHIYGSEDGIITITSPSIHGVRHAFATLAQLFFRHSQGGIYSPYFPVNITDYPRFAHRGLNLDISRNEITPEDVKRTLSMMRWTKLNKLHLHATDSQSWPLDIPTMPELAQKGAYRAVGIWSSDTLRQVQEFAQRQGIELYLELDMPGHTASIHHSHPELIAGYNAPLLDYSAAEPPSGQLRLNSSLMPAFLDGLLNDLLPRIKPYSKHFHVGGDELNTKIYTLDPTINSSDKAILQPLLQAFYDTILPHLSAHNLTPIFWQETLLDWNLTLPKHSIIQIWRPSSEALSSVLARGYRVLFGAASHWYLDCGFGIFLDRSVSSPDDFNDWCAPYKSWRMVYSYNPLHGLSVDDLHLVHGGEVHLWGELVDSINLDGKLWPRAAAAAEVLWIGPGGLKGVIEDTTRRLAEWRERIVELGVAADVVQMTWCLMNECACVA